MAREQSVEDETRTGWPDAGVIVHGAQIKLYSEFSLLFEDGKELNVADRLESFRTQQLARYFKICATISFGKRNHWRHSRCQVSDFVQLGTIRAFQFELGFGQNVSHEKIKKWAAQSFFLVQFTDVDRSLKWLVIAVQFSFVGLIRHAKSELKRNGRNKFCITWRILDSLSFLRNLLISWLWSWGCNHLPGHFWSLRTCWRIESSAQFWLLAWLLKSSTNER